MRAIRYVVGYVRGAAIGVPCANLLPAAPDTEGTARMELNATFGEIHTKSLNLGLQRFNVFILTEGLRPGYTQAGLYMVREQVGPTPLRP